jgi:hypothetical protein
MDKHSSLLVRSVSVKEKSFNNIEPRLSMSGTTIPPSFELLAENSATFFWDQFYKNFLGLFGAISYNVCR